MAITRQKKESILDDLNEQFKKARMVVFVNFHGLNTAASRKLRVLLKQSRGQYQVAKKTLIRKALQKISAFGSMPDLEGEIGMIFSPAESFIDIAKNLAKFIKEHKELGKGRFSKSQECRGADETKIWKGKAGSFEPINQQ